MFNKLKLSYSLIDFDLLTRIIYKLGFQIELGLFKKSIVTARSCENGIWYMVVEWMW